MSGKIIIKPRRAKEGPSIASSSHPTPSQASPGASDSSEKQYEEEDNQLDENDAQTEDDEQSEQRGGTPESVVPREGVPKPRGRPRGSGKSRGVSTPTGTPRPRGRPRGTGRGRARGRVARGGGLVIRLPGRAGEEGTTPGAEAEVHENAAGGGEEQTAAAATPVGAEEVGDAEGPMGGGKPFRKIHGKVYIIDGDEFITDEDPKGNTKVDQAGNLLEGTSLRTSIC
jgi:chromatin structure-remodeling complex protein RSC7